MDLSPVGAITAVSPVKRKRSSDDVEPPFAIDSTIPMEDNSCDASKEEPSRGLEEDDPTELEDEEDQRSDSALEESLKKVNFIA